MSIVTFYSYKGGVGRSMALANIAVLLARQGLKVLSVDWDLEAPGLERYFSYFEINPGGPGLLRMFVEARRCGGVNFREFTSSFDCEAPHPVTLLTSGRELDETYSRNLERFDWDDFFRGGGGRFVEDLRQQWRSEFDIVLIDSRTGLSDTGGICTIQLPDIAVAMFTANYQSLYGVRDVMRLAQKARQSLAYDRMPLSVLPLPARWGVQEFQETQVWLDRITEGVLEFYDDWLPRSLRPRDVVESTKIPQRDYFGFGEKLAVVEQGTTDPQGMGFVYEKIASFLASNFTDFGALVGTQTPNQTIRGEKSSPLIETSKLAESVGYLYDLFVSYDYLRSEWVLEFVESLKRELAVLQGIDSKIFMDLSEIRSDQFWRQELDDALLRSKVLIAFLTPHYFSSQFNQREFVTFGNRTLQTGKALLVPVVLRSGNFPPYAQQFQWVDLQKLSLQKSSPGRRSGTWQREINSIADQLIHMIAEAPPYDPSWTVPDALSDITAIRARLLASLNDPRWQWRSLKRLATEAALSEGQALDLLRSDPAVRFSRAKGGKVIVGLRTRVD